MTRAEYECQAFPDGTWSVRYVYPGGRRVSGINSGRVQEDARPLGMSALQSAELAASDAVNEHKAEQAEQARLRDGCVTFTVEA